MCLKKDKWKWNCRRNFNIKVRFFVATSWTTIAGIVRHISEYLHSCEREASAHPDSPPLHLHPTQPQPCHRGRPADVTKVKDKVQGQTTQQDRLVEMWTNSLHAEIAATLNASQRNQVGIGMNSSSNSPMEHVAHYIRTYLWWGHLLSTLKIFLEMQRAEVKPRSSGGVTRWQHRQAQTSWKL